MSRQDNSYSFCRLYRLLGFLCLTAGCLYQSFSFMAMYLEYPTTVEVNVMHLPALKFPAVTICNSNRGLRMKLGHQKQDFIIYCDYDGLNCFQQFYDYEYTNCYTFNAEWGKSDTELPMATLFNPISGKSSELLICMNLEKDEYTKMDKTVRARMTIHDSQTIPNPRYDGVSLLPDTFYSYGVRKNTIKLLEAPYQPGCRNYKSEKEKRVGALMSQEDCLAECLFMATLKKCNCTYHRFALIYEDIPCKKEKENCLKNNFTVRREACYKSCGMPCEKTTYDYIAVDSHKLQTASFQYDDKVLPFIKNKKEEGL
ncbi:amiloride-sensitive sodium channel subunit beta-2-like [Centruroides sculpturatus]|uniref:amiloride-sensitive sodium channel subunit beta-2-like n=1 Tax=Centruroides sculpturatus TaxID=218467 RepID=UPI000C6E8A77|nr:amiloride-sensitive sodium channel subunit beta-2-like [Centruroides sculpturatus]